MAAHVPPLTPCPFKHLQTQTSVYLHLPEEVGKTILVIKKMFFALIISKVRKHSPVDERVCPSKKSCRFQLPMDFTELESKSRQVTCLNMKCLLHYRKEFQQMQGWSLPVPQVSLLRRTCRLSVWCVREGGIFTGGCLSSLTETEMATFLSRLVS